MQKAGRNLGCYGCLYTLHLNRKLCSLPLEEVFVWVPAFPWIWFLQAFGQISARKKLVRKKGRCKSSCKYAFARGFAPPANASSIPRLPWRLCGLQQTFSLRVNLPCAAPPGLCSLRETGLDCPHSEGRSWQCSAPPSASSQFFTWNRSDLLIHRWHPTKRICWSRSLQRLKGRAEKICGWADFSLHFSCFIQVQRWMVKVCVINQ